MRPFLFFVTLSLLLSAHPVFAIEGIHQADFILIEKKVRLLTLFSNGEKVKEYKIALGCNPVGAKTMQGDNKTPEGLYTIDAKNPASSYHLSLHISYPNSCDQEISRRLGVPAGGDIMIHGERNGSGNDTPTRDADWTRGCIAVTNDEIEEIYDAVPVGTLVEITP